MNKDYNIFIINPAAGNGKGIKFYKALVQLINPLNCKNEVKFFFTDNKINTTNLVKELTKTYPNAVIYSVGGDGTLNQVINGVNENTRLGIIPAGSGNDFYRISKDVGNSKKINLGLVNDRKFINIASVGIDAVIAKNANEIKDSKVKIAAYPRAILKEFINNDSIELMLDDCKMIKENVTLLTACNGKYYGNGIPINPDYDLSSGLFNIILAQKLNRIELLRLFVKLFKGKQITNYKVFNYLTKQIKIDADYPLICNVDGEIIEANSFDFKVIENGVTLTNDYPNYVKNAMKVIK